ncbi:MAG TPA: hypothetical protein VK179_19235 [Bacteroidales bacterium]|nr:hypothetical protein [Bacteroidales bacterium]
MKLISVFWLTFFAIVCDFSQPGLKAQENTMQKNIYKDSATMLNRKNIINGKNLTHDQFNRGHYNNVFEQIQGRMAGLSVSKPGSNPNGFYELRMRGLRTLSGNTEPTIIIDGMIDAYTENLDIFDIESIRLISDASETSAYGYMGGNGLIVIETKSGAKGKPSLDYSTQVTLEKVAGKSLFMDAGEWRSLSDKLGFGTDFSENTDWPGEITRTAFSQVHNLSLSGGGRLSTYRASVSYRGGDGILLNSGYSQINGRFGFTQKAFKEKLTAGLNLAGTQRKSHFSFSDAFKYALISNPTTPVRSNDPLFDMYKGYFNQSLFDYYNPVEIIELNRNEGLTSILNLNARLTYTIVKNFSVSAFYAIQDFNTTGIQYFDPHSMWGGFNRHGLAQRQENSSLNHQFTLKLDYSHYLRDSRLFLNAGYENRKCKADGHSAAKGEIEVTDLSFRNLFKQIGFKSLNEPTFYQSSYIMTGFFANAGIENELWFFRVNGIYHGSSILPRNKWSFYGGASAGLNLARVINPAAEQKLILRTGIGTTGNLLPVSYLSYYRTGTDKNLLYNGYFVNEHLTGFTKVDLKSEAITEFNAGIDFSILKELFSGSFTFYSATTKGTIATVEVPVPPNISSPVYMNIGKVKDTGLEFVLGNKIISSGWSNSLLVTASYSLVNKPVSLTSGTNSYGIKDLGRLGSPGNYYVPLVRVSEDKPFGQLLALEFDRIDEAGNLILKDQPGTSEGIDQSDRIITGNGLPKFILGLQESFNLKNWDLQLFIRGVFGHSMVNLYRAFYETPQYLSFYNLTRSAKELKNPSGAYMTSSSILTSSHTEKASFLSLDNVSIGYTCDLSQAKHIKSVRLFLAGNNLFYITGYKGMDPNPRYGDSYDYSYNTLIPGIERTNTWFRTRSFTLGAGITF